MPVDPVFRSILYPVSEDELSTQVRLIWLGDTAVAVAEVGFAKAVLLFASLENAESPVAFVAETREQDKVPSLRAVYHIIHVGCNVGCRRPNIAIRSCKPCFPLDFETCFIVRIVDPGQTNLV